MFCGSSLWCGGLVLRCVIVVFPDYTHSIILIIFILLCVYELFCCCWCGGSVFAPCFGYAERSVLSSFAIILMEKRELVALLYLSS